MMKQFYKRIVTGTAFVLILVATLGMFTMAQADTTDYYALTVDYDSALCTVKLVYSGSTVTMKPEEPYYVSKSNAEITIRIETTSVAYEVDGMVANGNPAALSKNGNVFSYSKTIGSDYLFRVDCSPKTFDIEYCVDEGFSYDMTSEVPTEYTYGTKVQLPNPVLDGYEFVHWELFPSRDAAESIGTFPLKDGIAEIIDTIPVDGKTIFIKPKWRPIEYDVYRYDYVYSTIVGDHRGDLLSKNEEALAIWKAPMGSLVDGNMGDDRHYPGYHYLATPEYYTTHKVVMNQPEKINNVVYRFYLPNEYALEFLPGYDGEITFAEGVTVPTSHVFNVDTPIPDPIRTGYVFIGWKVTVIKDGTPGVQDAGPELTLGEKNEKWAGDNGTKLTLTACWKADEYTVTLDRNTDADNDVLTGTDDVSIHAQKYVYDTGLTIPDPTRKGYTFLGWLINGGETPQSGKLDPFLYANDITMVAQWKANDYTVTFDGNGATVSGLESLTRSRRFRQR